MNTKYDFKDLLKSKGLKVTKHRTSVLEILSKASHPLTADEIYLNIKNSNISINLSSIYKILDSLSTNKVISKCVLGHDNKTSYEISTSKHKHHLICKGCKEIFPLNNCPLCIYEKSVKDNFEFDVMEHKLEIYGYCKNCKNGFYKNN